MINMKGCRQAILLRRAGRPVTRWGSNAVSTLQFQLARRPSPTALVSFSRSSDRPEPTRPPIPSLAGEHQGDAGEESAETECQLVVDARYPASFRESPVFSLLVGERSVAGGASPFAANADVSPRRALSTSYLSVAPPGSRKLKHSGSISSALPGGTLLSAFSRSCDLFGGGPGRNSLVCRPAPGRCRR